METQNGTLELTVIECGCYMKDMVITLDGGASWFYQGYATSLIIIVRFESCERYGALFFFIKWTHGLL